MSTPRARTAVRFFFDFLSPYSSLALLRAAAFGERHAIEWHLRPVPFGAILSAHGLRGAGEIPVKRTYVTADVIRIAEADGLEFPGPPEHPFLSLNALRVAMLFLDDPRALELCAAMARTCWVEGRPLTDMSVCADVVRGIGLDPSDLETRIADRALKQRLRSHSEEAIALGVFGVPTFALEDGELFYGQDRMEHLALRTSGAIGSPLERARRMDERPLGFRREG